MQKQISKFLAFTGIAATLCGNAPTSESAPENFEKRRLPLMDISTTLWIAPSSGIKDVVWPSEMYTVIVTSEQDTIALVDRDVYSMNHDMTHFSADSLGTAIMRSGYKKQGNGFEQQKKPEVFIEFQNDIYYMTSPDEVDFVPRMSSRVVMMRYNAQNHGPMTQSLAVMRKNQQPSTLALNTP